MFQAGELIEILSKGTILIDSHLIARQLNVKLLDLRQLDLEHVREHEEILLACNFDGFQVAGVRTN